MDSWANSARHVGNFFDAVFAVVAPECDDSGLVDHGFFRHAQIAVELTGLIQSVSRGNCSLGWMSRQSLLAKAAASRAAWALCRYWIRAAERDGLIRRGAVRT